MPTYREMLEIIKKMTSEQLDSKICVRVDGEYWLAYHLRNEDGVPIPAINTVEDSE